MKQKETRTTIRTEYTVFAKAKSSGKFRPISMNRYPTPEAAWKAHEEWVRDWAKYSDDMYDLTTAEIRCKTIITTQTEWETMQVKEGE